MFKKLACLFAVSALSLAGCANAWAMTCKAEAEGMAMIASFNKNSDELVTKVQEKMKMEFASTEEAKAMEALSKLGLTEMNGDGMKYSVSRSGKVLTMTGNFDFKVMFENLDNANVAEILEGMEINPANGFPAFNTMKVYYEAQGCECK